MLFISILKAFPFMFDSSIILNEMKSCFQSILDVGCGNGKSFKWLKLVDLLLQNKLKLAYTVGIDVYLPWLRKARKIYHDVVHCDARFLPFRSCSFDVVTAFEVIEHLPKVQAIRLLKELDQIAKNEVIITTPVGQIIQSRQDYLINPYQRHLSSYYPKELKKLSFKVVGLRSIKSIIGETCQEGFSYKVKHPILKPLFSFIRKMSKPIIYYFPT